MNIFVEVVERSMSYLGVCQGYLSVKLSCHWTRLHKWMEFFLIWSVQHSLEYQPVLGYVTLMTFICRVKLSSNYSKLTCIGMDTWIHKYKVCPTLISISTVQYNVLHSTKLNRQVSTVSYNTSSHLSQSHVKSKCPYTRAVHKLLRQSKLKGYKLDITWLDTSTLYLSTYKISIK